MFELSVKPLAVPAPSTWFVVAFLGFFAFSVLSLFVPDAAGPIAYSADSDYFGLEALSEFITSLVTLLSQLHT